MAAGSTVIPVEEYLRTNYKPACEYIDGVLRPKSMGTRKHGRLQAHVGQLINVGFPEFEAASEVHVRIRENLYLIPDVIVQRRDHIQDPYPLEPVHLCIEIVSPDDRLSEVFAKCEEYHQWGVEMTWVFDPQSRRAWEYRRSQPFTEVPAGGALTAEGISILLTEVFSVL